MKKIQMFAYIYNGEFYAEHLIEDFDKDLNDLEYGDVFEGEYQIWEYPSGKIFSIKTDRKVEDDYWSPPSKNLWLPKLVYLKTDKEKIREAYKRLSTIPEKKNILSRILKMIGYYDK